MKNVLGFQTLIDFYGCKTTKIHSCEFIKKTLLTATKKMNLSVVKSTIHEFSPIGISGVIVIEESHIAIHTWPEYNYIALDFFTCNKDYDLNDGITWLKEEFEATVMEISFERRGDLDKAKKFLNEN